jgi:hypothetical protein
MVKFNAYSSGVFAESLVVGVERMLEVRQIEALSRDFDGEVLLRKWCLYVLLMWHKDSPMHLAFANDWLERSDMVLAMCKMPTLMGDVRYESWVYDMRNHVDNRMLVLLRYYIQWSGSHLINLIVSSDYAINEAMTLLVTPLMKAKDNGKDDELKRSQDKMALTKSIKSTIDDRTRHFNELFSVQSGVQSISLSDMARVANPVLFGAFEKISEATNEGGEDVINPYVANDYTESFISADEANEKVKKRVKVGK